MKKIFLVLGLLLVLAGALFVNFSFDPVVRNNLVLAIRARLEVGEKIVFVPDYSRDAPFQQWGITTNSVWLVDQVRQIVPYLKREGAIADAASVGIYPGQAYFSPYIGYRSFQVGGSSYPPEDLVFINERYILRDDPSQATVVGILVHELLHIQDQFFFQPDDILATESVTSAATTEVLAGMCRAGRKDACQAFWSDIEVMSLSAVEARLSIHKLGWIFDPLMDLLFRTQDQSARAEKWEQDFGSQEDVVTKYVSVPWNQLLIPGLLNHSGLRVSSPEHIAEPWRMGDFRFVMPLDDTEFLLGESGIWLLRNAYPRVGNPDYKPADWKLIGSVAGGILLILLIFTLGVFMGRKILLR